MINWLYRIVFGVERHVHDFDFWTPFKESTSNSGAIVVIYQKRECKTCGFTQINSQSASY